MLAQGFPSANTSFRGSGRRGPMQFEGTAHTRFRVVCAAKRTWPGPSVLSDEPFRTARRGPGHTLAVCHSSAALACRSGDPDSAARGPAGHPADPRRPAHERDAGGAADGAAAGDVRARRDSRLAADRALRRARRRHFGPGAGNARGRRARRHRRHLDALCRDPADGDRRRDLSARAANPDPALDAGACLACQHRRDQRNADGRHVRVGAVDSGGAARGRRKLARRPAGVVRAGPRGDAAFHVCRAAHAGSRLIDPAGPRPAGGRTGKARSSGCWVSRSAPTTHCFLRPTPSSRTT